MKTIYKTNSELGFGLTLLNPSDNAEKLIYFAMHQCYSEDSVAKELREGKYDGVDSNKLAKAVVDNLLKGNRGHYGPLEEGHQFMFAAEGFPHSVITHLRTHRIGISFDVQSGRYTGQRFVDVANRKRSVEDVFYFRPVNQKYASRQGKKYKYSEAMLSYDKEYCLRSCSNYKLKVESEGFSEEHARDMMPYNFVQDFVVSMNLRTALHLDAMRNKADVQLETRAFAQLLNEIMVEQCPHILEWWNDKSKRMLAA